MENELSDFKYTLNDPLFIEIFQNIQAQYRDANIKELLLGILEIVEKYVTSCIKSLENEGLNLTTARGDFLDLWGNILGISRYIELDESQIEQNYFNFRQKNFLKLQFYNKESAQSGGIADTDLRPLLLFLAQKMYNAPSVYDINNFLENFFLEFGGTLAIRDTRDMSFYYVYFKEELPVWLNNVLNKYDLLPRPAGVGVKFQTAERRIFGFKTNDTIYNQEILGNFRKANFKDLEE